MATPRQSVLIEPLKMAEGFVHEARDLVRIWQGKPELRLVEIQICMAALQLQELIAIRQAIRDQTTQPSPAVIDHLFAQIQRRIANARKKSARR